MGTEERIAKVPGFWTQQFAYYLNEHRHPGNRATHMVGIPVIVVTLVLGGIYMAWDWRIGLAVLLGGEVVGWTFQLIGHRIEGNKPALLKRPISFLMGPLMVLIEMLELVG